MRKELPQNKKIKKKRRALRTFPTCSGRFLYFTMDQQAGYSPSFKRPTEIMRMRRKKARSDVGVRGCSSGQDPSDSRGQSSPSAACVRPFSPGPLFQTQRRSGTKRRNPFANIENTESTYSPKKKLFIYNENEGEAENSTEKVEDEKATESSRVEAEHHQDTKSPESPSSISPSYISPSSITPASISPPVCTEYPTDWSLKTRVLFTSPLSLSWTEQPKAQEEAVGLSNSCRAQFFSPPHNLQDPRSCTELRSAFQQSLVYWQHPSIPWLSLFPRINADRNFSGQNTSWAQDVAIQQSLMKEWSISLSSLYSLLKSRLCPYFYLCSFQFTVLFRAAGLAGCGNITALISPTTRGLREAMKAEGIEFSLPLVERRNSRQAHSPIVDEGEEELCSQKDEGEDDGADEDDSFSWLKEMGVQDKIRRPDGITIQLCKEANSVRVDHKAESVVCVEGPHTFTLINFFINWKGVVAAAGSQAGLPPTLLAPAAFKGATMHMLKVRSVNVKSQVGSTYQNISSLEVTGPILPSSLQAITTLLRPAQKGNFSAVLYTHPPSAVMNVNSRNQQCGDWSVDLSGCGVRPSSIKYLQQPSSLGKTALTHVTMNNYSYTWKT